MTTSLAVHRLSRPGGRIAYRIEGEGPLVVCIPGMGELSSSYRFVVPALTAAGFRVATMDLRGHGDSDTTFDSYDAAAAGSDALALLAHLGGDGILVGNSMGAGAAVWAAAEDPALVRGIALLGPFVRNTAINPLAAALFRVAMGGPWAAAAWLGYLPTLYPLETPADFAAHRDDIRAWLRTPGAARAFRRTTRTDHAPAAARIERVAAAALVVMGTADPDFPDPEDEARWIADRLNARLLLIDGGGHYPQAESPDLVGPALVDFAREVFRA
ncbi:alpha/beta fold hydrolase [Microbacterium sp. SORGH_AS_0888]|uniref:alpha/beta fold hydrolase n=1 Tax=Microbacterium sp. SORGH_AS_0888 TaxID=3041791 RepID=UPI00277D2A61|nr:alpha/beta hydrolase [Microbacterium sp. SORGH_AS_0888]MDQ1130740.1 pimeloyl-ACP methyl ester carboxylesterase [Microbacterium sp. SORGH_AS_0888]